VNAPLSREDALNRYPELAALVTIEDAGGWVFRVASDSNGEPECVMASRTVQLYTDALFIYDRNTITGARVLTDEGGGCVWMKHGGSLEEIVFELLGLPEPGEPGAPSLVKRSSLLWIP
jgi:hypothetical protein